MKQITAILKARLREFYRDRASFGWNFIFPFFIIIAFYFIFTNDNQEIYKVGLVGIQKESLPPQEFFQLKHVNFIELSEEEGKLKIEKHKIDLLLKPEGSGFKYWVNSSSQNGYFLERILRGASEGPLLKEVTTGKEVKYLDWVFPGVLAMNVMFTCLWGVGWVVVKYRQEGYLKRLRATPIKAYQFLIGQVAARYVIAMVVTFIVYIGSAPLIGFETKGSYLDLFIVYSLGVTCLISIGLLVASRTTSKEFADGILNVLSWPMMLLSEVWFSLEGSGETVRWISQLLPLTHLVDSSRRIMTEGATLADVFPNVLIMGVSTAVLLTLSSFIFRWIPE